MAQFLYRLGLAAYDHRKKFIAAWVALLAIIGLLAGLFMGKLSNTFSLPGTETERVLNLMGQELPELSGGNGTIVFQAKDREPLTAEQHAAISEALAEMGTLDTVRSVIDPFEMQTTLDDSVTQLAEGKKELEANRTKIEEGKAQFADGEAQLAAGERELEDGQKEIDKNAEKLADGREQLEAARPGLESGQAELAEAKKKLDAAAEELAAGKKELAAGKKELAAGKKELAAGEKQFKESKQQLADGKAQIEAAKKKIAAGQKKLDEGRAQFGAGSKQLASSLGLNSFEEVGPYLTATAKQLDAAETEAQAGLKKAQAGLEQAQAGKSEAIKVLAQIDQEIAVLTAKKEAHEAAGEEVPPEILEGLAIAQAKRVGVTDAIAKADAGIAAAQAGIDAAQQGLSQVAKGRTQLAQAQGAYDQLAPVPAQLKAAEKELAAGKKAIAENEKKLAEGTAQREASRPLIREARAQVAAGEAKIAEGQAALDAGQAQYEDGLAQYEAGLAEFNAGKKLFDANEAKLVDGEKQLDDARRKIAEGTKELEKNRAIFEESRKELTDGEAKLAEGEATLIRGERTSTLAAPMRFVSDDKTTAISQVLFYDMAESLTAEQRADITALAAGPEAAGVEVLFSKEIVSDLNSIFGPAEMIGFVIAGIVLLIMLGTFVAAGLPLLMALLGVAAGVGGTLALSSLVDMQSITPALALMLGLAVGIDYSLFIVHRHRTQLVAGMDMRQSIGRAIGTSGNAVVFAGLTVIIALSALVVSGLPFIGILGLSAAFTVLMAVLLSVSLLPALLAVIGEKILPKKARVRRAAAIAAGAGVGAGASIVGEEAGEGASASAGEAAGKQSASMWWVKTLTKVPWLTAVASIAVLAIIALPVRSMLTALPDGGSEPYGSQAQRAFAITSDKFGEGYNGQLIVLNELPTGLTQAEADDAMLDVAERIAGVDGVFAAVPAATNEALTYGAIQVVPTTGPASPDTETLVHTLRGMSSDIKAETGVGSSVTGQVAAQIDVSEKINAALPPYLMIVVGLSMLLLLLVFRSIVVPLIATLGFLLSLAAAFGATVAVYQWGWLGQVFDVHNPSPIMSFLPILLTGILFGLAMDYQVFLVTAIREAYAHGSSARRAVKEGFNLAAPVVVAAALIMVSVFASFIFAHLTMIRPIGFALAVGVLFDAFVVRMTLTPAIMHLLGDKAWYLPKWLDRILPDVDVEGAGLERALTSGQAAADDEALNAKPVDVSILDDSLRS